MSITIFTEDQIKDIALGYFRNVFPSQDLSDAGFLGLEARALAQLLLLLQADIQRVDDDAIPAYQLDADGTIRTRASSQALDDWAFVFGLPSDTVGIYGRKGAVASTGGVGDPTGVTATIFPAGSLLSDSTGQVQVQLNAAFQVGVSTPGSSSYTAVTKGAISNLPAGSVLTFLSPPAGGNPTVTLTVALSGGADLETDAELLVRLLFRLQNPPKGGTAADYKFWAENAFDTSGGRINIARGYVFPLRGGLGTVDVMPLLPGSGLGRSAGNPASSGTIANKIQTYLDSVRPVTAVVRVIQPNMPTNKALLIRVYLFPNGTKYEYDWDDSSGGVASSGFAITARTANTLTFAAPITNLDNAIALGLNPRLQIINSTLGANATPYQRRVISKSGSTYTLDTALSPLPTVGDLVFAGGPIVDAIAQTILNYIDSMGPSRQSGYANPFDPWEDKVTISRLADIILETKDTDGTRFGRFIPDIAIAHASIPGGYSLTIALNTPPTPFFTPGDYQPKDIGGICDLDYVRSGGIFVLRAQ